MEQYKPFSLTYVLYRAGDRLGQFLALASLAPVFIVVAYATLLLSRRDLHVAALATGQLLNEALNYVLKHTLQQPRPLPPFPAHHAAHVPVYGMPSNHAQFVAFFAVYVTLFLRPSKGSAWMIAASWMGCAVVLWSRVYLGYHTLQQVGVGFVVGGLAGAAWFAFTFRVLQPQFAFIVRMPLARYLHVRDCSQVEDITGQEYAAVYHREKE